MKKSKRIFPILLILIVLLCSCSKSQAAQWQEQYDLGTRYLSEGNYEEAIIAFTAAIEIDPNRAEAYVGRGDAYIGRGETEENLAAAMVDYETALELDETLVSAWLSLAEVLVQQGNLDRAIEILQQGVEATGDSGLQQRLEELQTPQDSRFYESEFFIPFNNLEGNVQEGIESLMELLKSGDYQQSWINLQDLEIPDAAQEFIAYRTEYSGYRLEIYVIRPEIEMRPNEGAGYKCKISGDAGGEYEFGYWSGECENWNWNGAYSGRVQRKENLTASAYFMTVEVQGQMIDGLMDGEIIEYSVHDGLLPQEDRYFFENGALIRHELYDENGELRFSSGPEGSAMSSGLWTPFNMGFQTKEQYEISCLWND